MPSKASSYRRAPIRKKMLISADDYQRMGAAGIFEDKPPVELIAGEIYTMSPLSPSHNSHVDKIAEFFTIKLFGNAKIRNQGSIRLDEYSEPEPDITILRFDENFYHQNQATAKDVHLIIEVAIHTLATDRTIKCEQYAAADIPEYWIVAPEKGIIEVYQQPENGTYLKKKTYQIKDEWILAPFSLAVKGSDFLIP